MKTDQIIDSLVQLAADLENPAGGSRLAAAVVHKGRIIAYGFNKKKTDPFQAKRGKNKHAIYLHAETDAIKKALRHIDLQTLSRCTLIVVRVKRPGSFSPDWIRAKSRPCLGCRRAALEFDLRRVIYLDEEGQSVIVDPRKSFNADPR